MNRALQVFKVLFIFPIVTIWYGCSILVNITWKKAYEGHPQIIQLTFLQFVFAEALAIPIFLCCKPASTKTISSLFRPMTIYHILIGVAFAFGQLCTNASFSFMTVSASYIIKITEPLIALGIGITIFKEPISLEAILYIVCLLIAVGVASVTDHTMTFAGFLFAALSNVTFQVRNLFIKLRSAKEAGNSLNPASGIKMFLLSNTIGVLVLLILTIIDFFYNRQPLESLLNLDLNCMFLGFWFAGQHVTSFFVLQNVFITTHSVLNLVKRIVIIVVSAIVLHTAFTSIQVLSILMAALAFYAYIKTITTEESDNSETESKTVSPRMACMKPLILITFLVYSGIVLANYKQIVSPRMTPKPEISAIWSYNQRINSSAVDLLEKMSRKHPTNQITVYCGNSECIERVENTLAKNIVVKQLKVLDITDDTALSSWARRHAIMKIVSGSAYGYYLQKALQLSLLWKNGGVVIDLNLHVSDNNAFLEKFAASKENSCIMDTDQLPLAMCHLEKQHPFIRQIMYNFLNSFNIIIEWPHPFDFGLAVKRSLTNYNELAIKPLPEDTTAEYSSILKPFRNVTNSQKFAILNYTTINIGDEIQSVAAAHFLPQIDRLIPRDGHVREVAENTTLVMNGFWYIQHIELFSALNIDPVLVSIHFDQENLVETKEALQKRISLFRNLGIVGSRDTETLRILLELGIQAKMTGCLTLFFQNPFTDLQEKNITYLVDGWVPEIVPLDIMQGAEVINHNIPRMGEIDRFIIGQRLIEKYAEAKVVVTSRIHAALPCVALGTPVVFLNLRNLYGAKYGSPTPRASGLTSLFHTVDMFKLSEDEAREYLENFDWNNPPPNPNPELANALREAAWSILMQNKDIESASLMYGLQPYINK